ncbi:MAG TPA: protoglobin domain-containing protein [Candidatus Thermoplasmatota archaeon]|nr:protoglobin domain-containing protein [Candidatus Thermoplasmatota archaeon]
MARSSRDRPAHSYAAEMGMGREEIQRRKEWLEITPQDEERIRSLHTLAHEYADEVIDDLYRHFLTFPEVADFFKETSVLDHVKAMQRDYFVRLTGGNYDDAYVEERLKIGAVHERVGVDVKWYLGAYNHYIRFVGAKIFESMEDRPEEALATYFALQKLIYLDIGLAIDTYVFQRERTIRMQQEAIRELSTPVLQVREGLLILPIVGAIDSQRALQLTEALLASIARTRARVVVIDITGVPAVDSLVANHLVQTVEAARLMGATAILTGISPEIAQTLVTLGLSLGQMRTVGDLQGGIEEAERLLGYRVTKVGRPEDSYPADG